MHRGGVFSDPAIISSSQDSGNSETQPKNGALEPESTLSKLLDSAMANAAKEASPDCAVMTASDIKASPEENNISSRRSSISNLVPSTKSDHARIYTIQQLLELRTTPEAALFDTSKLPDSSFWQIRSREGKQSSNKNSSNSQTGGGKRNRRNNSSSSSVNINSANSLNWKRKPAGFLRQPDLDDMSREKISQLLGEVPDEESPEWDVPNSNADMKIEMGNTVEDFERWKQHMRQEEKRKQGDDSYSESAADIPSANEVDSFFSYVQPKELVSESTSSSVSKQSDAKSSRFSSFFGGSGTSTPEVSRSSTVDPDEACGNTHPAMPKEHSGNSRFFRSTPHPENSPNPPAPSQKLSQGLPPGIPPQFLHMGGMPHSTNITQPPGFSPHTGQPGTPSASGAQGAPTGIRGSMGASTNDSFFLSLLNKKEGDQENSKVAHTPTFSKLGVPQKLVQPTENVPSSPAKFPGPKNPRQNSTGSSQEKPPQSFPYHGPSQGQQILPPGFMAPHPSMQLPPGMFPPGMYPPGAQPPLQFDQNGRNVSGQLRDPSQERQNYTEPPPWIRYGPGFQGGIPPQGFPQGMPGYPPGFQPVTSNQQQQQQNQPQSQPQPQQRKD